MPIDSGPSGKSAAVTPDDDDALPVGRGIYVGTAGDITGRLIEDSEDRVFKGIAAGVEHGLRFSHIRETGTTADDIVILF
jgi:hypothetical protein